mgnify:CR=1 FL=1
MLKLFKTTLLIFMFALCNKIAIAATATGNGTQINEWKSNDAVPKNSAVDLENEFAIATGVTVDVIKTTSIITGYSLAKQDDITKIKIVLTSYLIGKGCQKQYEKQPQ